MLLNGWNREKLTDLAQLKGPRAAKPPAARSMLSSWSPFISGRKITYVRELHRTNGKPKCNRVVQDTFTQVLWDKVAANVNACPVTSHYSQSGQEAFKREAAKKLINWWSQSGSEAAQLKKTWNEDKIKAATSSAAGV